MFEFLKNLLPLKVSTSEGFIEVMNRENCRMVVVEPLRTAENSGQTATVGTIADFHYSLKFMATTPRGKRVIYTEEFFARFGSERGFADSDARRDASIRLFLLAELKVKDLRTNLPGVQIDLMGSGGKPMDETMYTNLHRDAETYNISV